MAVFTWQTVSAVLIVAVFSAADDSCVKTLEDGDTNQDGILSEQEFVTFLKAEAMKGKRNSAVELRCENTETQKEINHLFATFATEGQNGISIRETEITDDRDAVPAQEKAVLELLCERTKSFLADQSTLGATKEANIKPEDAMNTCPDQFQTAVACAISSCSTFVDVCHSKRFPTSLAAPAPTNMTSKPGNMTTCAEIEDGLCSKLFAGDDCCLDGCSTEFLSLTLCFVKDSTGVDSSNCPFTDCLVESEIAGSNSSSTNERLDAFLDIFDFQVTGVDINADVAQKECPEAWQTLVSCAISGCDFFMCGLESVESLNSTNEPPGCSQIEDTFCTVFGAEQSQQCCTSDCAPQYYDLMACIVLYATGEDRSDCPLPDCPIPVSGGSDELVGMSDQNIVLGEFLLSNYGIDLDALSAYEQCPLQSATVVNCVLEVCELPLEACQDSLNLHGMTDGSLVNQAPPTTCEEHGSNFCQNFDIPESCCLSSCELAMYNLSTCVAEFQHFETFPYNCLKSQPECIGPAEQFDEVADFFNFGGYEDHQWDGSALSELLENFTAFQLDVFGTQLSTDSLGVCSFERVSTLGCLFDSCSNFGEVCRTADTPEGQNFSLTLTGGLETCSDFESGFCQAFSALQPDCCLSSCSGYILELTRCVANATFGREDLFFCGTPPCVVDAINGTAVNEVWVNSSFLISNGEGIMASKLKEGMGSGDGVLLRLLLQESFRDFVQSVVDTVLGGIEGRKLGRSKRQPPSASDTRERRLASSLDPGSVEVYDFVDVPCSSSTTAVSRQQSGNKTCIAAFGKYRINLEPEEDAIGAYETFSQATQTSIAEGGLQEALQRLAEKTNATVVFVVEGVSSVVDESFDPRPSLMETSDVGSGEDPSTVADGADDQNTSDPTATSTPAANNATPAPGDESKADMPSPDTHSFAISVFLTLVVVFSFAV